MRYAMMCCLVAMPACATSDALDSEPGLELRLTAAPAPDSDQRPVYELWYAGSPVADVLDAGFDPVTSKLVWIDPAGALWSAPAATAPEDGLILAREVLPGLALARGRVAFAVRLEGPETAPFLADLRTQQVVALDDAPGPDEVLAFSPSGDEVLLLSGRTGLASLFAVGVHGRGVRQLTNVGLRPGPALDRDAVTPPPARARDVAWTAREISYRAGEWAVHVAVDQVAR
jgi:hypothetical protein